MANSKQAAKRAKQAGKSRTANMGLRTTLRTAIKKVRPAIETGQVDEAKNTLLPSAIKLIDVNAKKGVIHRNTADRNKSRLTRAVMAAAAAPAPAAS